MGDGFLRVLIGLWIFGWIPIDMVIGGLTTPCDRTGACGMDSSAPGIHPYHIFLMSWFGVVLIPAALTGLSLACRVVWNERPRRVSEPVLTDLRETI